jgi:hypothetical protein
MQKEILESQAQTLADRFSDSKGLGFYCMAILKLGFSRCYELASLSLELAREGRIRTSAARYFNGCVMKEIKERGL